MIDSWATFRRASASATTPRPTFASCVKRFGASCLIQDPIRGTPKAEMGTPNRPLNRPKERLRVRRKGKIL